MKGMKESLLLLFFTERADVQDDCVHLQKTSGIGWDIGLDRSIAGMWGLDLARKLIWPMEPNG